MKGMEKYFKLEIFIPETHFADLRKALQSVDGILIFMAFMGGSSGLLTALLQMVIPIIPWLHIFG